MPAQIGYFDTLKSVAGKIFAYLASITITGTDGKTLTVEDNSIVNQDLSSDANPTFAAPILTSMKASGAEQLKIWTYTHTVTAGDVVSTLVNIAISAVVLAKVRSITYAWYDTSIAYARGNEVAGVLRITTTTNCQFYLGGIEAGDTISLTIIEAI